MSLIKTRNLLHENAPYTRLSFAESLGTTALRVENTSGLTTSWAIQIGEVGQEQTEVVIGTNTNGTSITCGATAFDHPADTPVYFVKYNQVVFERSTTNGTSGTASPMTNGTITYQPDNFFTVFDDTSGSSAYGYRTYFRNSVLAVNSTESDWITFAGHDFYSLGKMRSRMRNKLWNSDYLDDDTIDEWINECKDMMANKVIQTNEDYSMGTVAVSFGTDGLGTISTADFVAPTRIWVTYNGRDKYASTKMGIHDFVNSQIFSSTHPYHAWIDNNIVVIKPSDSGTAEIVYQRFGTAMVNDTDILPIPMRSYTNIFTDYAKSMALSKDQKETEAQAILTRVGTAIEDFAQNIAPRDKTGPTKVRVVEPVSGETWGL